MKIIEYRIIMPMTVDEYQIGQLYTIQKKSRLESEGAGSGVEIIKNEPYEKENERGQYTYKIYHVDQRMPLHLKTIVGLIFPKSALLFEEEGWNRYPYTRTNYRHQLFKGFSIDIETQFNPDIGDNENVFKLNKTELSNRVVEIIDIVNDNVSPNDYKEAEDPKKYKSTRTSRGPLNNNWIEELKQKRNEGGKINYMCAYKLCRVECNVWGLQSRIEKAICETVLRNMLLMTHRQAWCWQDEYVDLTIQQVRLLEAETQEILNEKMRQHTTNKHHSINKTTKIVKNDSSVTLNSICQKPQILPEESSSSSSIIVEQHSSAHCVTRPSTIIDEDERLNMISMCSSISEDENDENDEFKDSISIKSDEFFDAKSICSNYPKIEENSNQLTKTTTIGASNAGGFLPPTKLKINKQLSFNLPNRPSLTGSIENSINTLVLVIHGGNVMSITNSINNDFINLKTTFDKVIKTNYFHAKGRIEYRLVPCEDLCRDALTELASLSAFNRQQNLTSEISGAPIPYHLYESIPYHVLPLFAVSKSKEYSEKLTKLILECNRVYQEFVNLNEDFAFNGQVVIIGDSMGSILAFDAISTLPPYNNNNNNNNNTMATTSLASKMVNLQSSLPATPNTPLFLQPNSNLFSTQKSCPAYVSTGHVNNTHHFQQQQQQQQNQASNLKQSLDPNDTFSSDSSSKASSSLLSFISEHRLEFNVAHFFSFGSLLGLLIAFRKHTGLYTPEKLGCKQMYNLFHLNDPLATRIEPLLSKEFSQIEPCTVSPYSIHPYGDGTPFLLDVYLMKHREIFEKDKNEENPSMRSDNIDFLRIASKNWWGTDRIDYVLYAPENLSSFPRQSLPYVFHGCFWESVDVAAFILRTIMKIHDPRFIESKSVSASMIKGESEKWINRSNRVKLRNLTPNHRANDVIALVDQEQILTAKFSYGALDFALSGEKVDIYIFKNKEWKYLTTEMTDNHGKLKYKIPFDKRLAQGVHPVMLKVKCDNSIVEFNLCVLPPKTETVVFSIDASFAANISLSGTDPKVRAGAVDIVRYWQDLGYLIIYVTARPDIQQSKVTNWLAQHNFPKGMMYFSDGISAVPFRQKAETLRNLVLDNQLILRAGYGAARDIPMYQSMNLDRDNIFVVGKTHKKKCSEKAAVLTSYATHLNDLKAKTRSANGNAKLILKKSSFSLKNLHQSFNDISFKNHQNDIDTNQYHRQMSTTNYNTIHSLPTTSSSFTTTLLSNK